MEHSVETRLALVEQSQGQLHTTLEKLDQRTSDIHKEIIELVELKTKWKAGVAVIFGFGLFIGWILEHVSTLRNWFSKLF